MCKQRERIVQTAFRMWGDKETTGGGLRTLGESLREAESSDRQMRRAQRRGSSGGQKECFGSTPVVMVVVVVVVVVVSGCAKGKGGDE